MTEGCLGHVESSFVYSFYCFICCNYNPFIFAYTFLWRINLHTYTHSNACAQAFVMASICISLLCVQNGCAVVRMFLCTCVTTRWEYSRINTHPSPVHRSVLLTCNADICMYVCAPRRFTYRFKRIKIYILLMYIHIYVPGITVEDTSIPVLHRHVRHL